MAVSKGPAAVVVMERQGKVLALTRGIHDIASLHLPGGKWEPGDGGTKDRPDVVATARRELMEETGIRVSARQLTMIGSFVSRTLRPVTVFKCKAPGYAPSEPKPTPAGIVGWVPPASMLGAWCPFSFECRVMLSMAGAIRTPLVVARAMLRLAHLRDNLFDVPRCPTCLGPVGVSSGPCIRCVDHGVTQK